MKILHSFGFDVAALAYRGTTPGSLPVMVPHMFEAAADGQLHHYIEGQLRAVVPPEGVDDYVAAWPDALPVVRELKNAEASAAATLTAAADARQKEIDEAVAAALAVREASIRAPVLDPKPDTPAVLSAGDAPGV